VGPRRSREEDLYSEGRERRPAAVLWLRDFRTVLVRGNPQRQGAPIGKKKGEAQVENAWRSDKPGGTTIRATVPGPRRKGPRNLSVKKCDVARGDPMTGIEELTTSAVSKGGSSREEVGPPHHLGTHYKVGLPLIGDRDGHVRVQSNENMIPQNRGRRPTRDSRRADPRIRDEGGLQITTRMKAAGGSRGKKKTSRGNAGSVPRRSLDGYRGVGRRTGRPSTRARCPGIGAREHPRENL